MKHKNKKLIIHPLTVIFYLLTLALSSKKTALCAIFCSLIHEMGHYFSARVMGVKVKAFILYPFGAEMRLSELRSYKCDIAIALFGPAVNIAAAVVGYFLHIGGFFIAYNLTLAVLNLLPINHLDGGTVLSSLLMLFFTPKDAEKVVNIVSFFVLIALWMLSVYIFMMEGGSPSLFFISVTLFASTFLR